MAVEETIRIKIQANAEEFKIVSDIINRELGRLGKNFEVLEGTIKQSASAMRQFDGSSKKFNKGLMSISLILQDLPYGFRGIQNNIPALVQGMGVVYLAISAVTAAMTYFVLQGDKMSKGTKNIYDSFKGFINGIGSDLYNSLKPAFDSIVNSIKILWDLFGSYLVSVFKDTWDIIIKVISYVGNQFANIFKIVTSVIKGDWKTFSEVLVSYFRGAWNIIIDILAYSLKTVGNLIGGVVGIFDKDFGKLIANSTKITADKFANSFKYAVAETKKETIDLFSLFKKEAKGAEVTIDDFTKTMNRFNEEIRKISILFLQFRQMSELDYLEGEIRALNAAIDDLAGQSTDEAIRKLEELIQRRGELLLTQKVGEAMQYAGGEIEVIKETEDKPVFDKNQFKAGKEAMETWFDSIRKKFKEMQKLAKESEEYLMKIGIGMMNALGPALDMLLEKGGSIGEVLSKAFSDLIKKLAKVAIAAAIVVALMALLGLVDLSQIGKTFGMLVGQGMGMSANLFGGVNAAPLNPTAGDAMGNITADSAMQNSTLVAQVSGNDLLVLLNRTSRNNNNTF